MKTRRSGGADCRGWVLEWATNGYPEPIVDLPAEAAVARDRYRAATM